MVEFVLQAIGLACAMFAIVIGGAWLYDYLDWRIWEDDDKVKNNGVLFDYLRIFQNGRHLQMSWQWDYFGIGVNFTVGDTRKYIQLNLLWLCVDVCI